MKILDALKAMWRRREPAFNQEKGGVTADGDVNWTNAGPVSPAAPDFVLRLADGSYYQGQGVGGLIERTAHEQLAAGFPTRMAAARAAGENVAFAHAWILERKPAPRESWQ